MKKDHPKKIDFLIAGVQKGGTSALHAYLALHPQLVPPAHTKELQFFVKPTKDVDWYHQQFPRMHYKDKFCYESTPDYICGYHFIHDIFRYKEKHSRRLKLILIFREPVSRAYSQWNMTCRFIESVRNPESEGGKTLKRFNPGAFDLYASMDEVPSFERCFEMFMEKYETLMPVDDLRQLNRGGDINQIPGQFFVRGLYIFQLRAIFDFFHREDALLLTSSDLKTKTLETLNRVTRFLEIDDYRWPDAEIHVPRHVSQYGTTLPGDTQKRIQRFYAPYNDAFFSLAGISPPAW